MLLPLVCPVRGCGRPFGDVGAALVCAAGHRFDRARSGYVNLLQPQDKRSREPGDSKAAAQARRRSIGRGVGAALLDGLAGVVADLGVGAGARVLDVGCGEGSFLAALAARFGFEAWGVDLSPAAVDLAARAWPDVGWVVANADRALPFADASFDLVLSVTARRHPDEFRRVLRPDGHVVVAVSAPDDLAELRAILHGAVVAKDRAAGVLEAFVGFPLRARFEARAVVTLDRDGVADLLASTYRGARHAERDRAAAVDRLAVTVGTTVLVLAAPAAPPGRGR